MNRHTEKEFTVVVTKQTGDETSDLLTLEHYDYLGFGVAGPDGVTSHEIRQNGKLEVYRWDSQTTPETPGAIMIGNHPYILLGELHESQRVESPQVPFREGNATLIFSLK